MATLLGPRAMVSRLWHKQRRGANCVAVLWCGADLPRHEALLMIAGERDQKPADMRRCCVFTLRRLRRVPRVS
ncbi:MAG TPA: hypothetical protein VGM07_04625 [Stellaceae bacterium]|jgi:hypothetical protein